MPLPKLLLPEYVRTDLKVGSVPRLLERMAALLAMPTGLDVESVLTALRAREDLSPTALGHGVALPHAAVPGLQQAKLAFARLSTPLAMGAPDGLAVDLVCALIVPDSFSDSKLRLLAEIAEKLESAQNRQLLRSAPNAIELHRLLVN
jgi:PTS system nitrogen regulatory IIA component